MYLNLGQEAERERRRKNSGVIPDHGAVKRGFHRARRAPFMGALMKELNQTIQ
jgi:hypothetical protein